MDGNNLSENIIEPKSQNKIQRKGKPKARVCVVRIIHRRMEGRQRVEVVCVCESGGTQGKWRKVAKTERLCVCAVRVIHRRREGRRKTEVVCVRARVVAHRANEAVVRVTHRRMKGRQKTGVVCVR